MVSALEAQGNYFYLDSRVLPQNNPRWRRRETTGKEMEMHCGLHISTIYKRAGERGLPYISMIEKPKHREAGG